MAGWDTAVDVITEMHEFNNSQQGRGYLQTFAESFAGKMTRSDDNPDGFGVGRAQNATDQMIAGSVQLLPICDPVFVNAEMSELIDYAYRNLPPGPLFASDMLTNHGVAYFETPVIVHDVHGKQYAIRCMQWNKSRFNGTDDPPYLADEMLDARVPGALPPMLNDGVLVTLFTSGLDNQEDWEISHSERLYRLPTLYHLAAVEFGITYDLNDPDRSLDRRLADPATTANNYTIQPLLRTLFYLCAQTISVSHSAPLQRPVWKRASKKWKPIKTIVVFKLRRAKSPPREDGQVGKVEWSHRWPVSGHWRQWPYKLEDGRTEIRPVWVSPHIKGPPDKEIVFKRRAFELVR